MALFMDVHHMDDAVTIDAVAGAHAADLATQGELRRALPAVLGRRGARQDLLPGRRADADAANTVHREAHGLVADEIYPVIEGN